MTPLYKVRTSQQLSPADPLHVGNIYNKERLHRGKMQDRQDLILYLAHLHQAASDPSVPRAFNQVELSLTALREWVYDYRPALNYFFDVEQLGYSFSEQDHQLSLLYPKDLGRITPAITRLELEHDPGERPDGTISKVIIQQVDGETLEQRLRQERLHHLLPPVRWLLKRRGQDVNFIFKPAGKLKQRDTSVWPIAAVENWPSWLREELFGAGIDIDSAYTQFIMQRLEEIYAGRRHLLKLLYPDLVKLLEDKTAWRRELCEQTLGLEWVDDNIALVKTVCMSLANGSRISPSILSGGGGFSVTADIIIKALDDISVERVERIGHRLQAISKQFVSAKKAICTAHLRLNPSRSNQKKVFSSYFEWERRARYLIWEGIERHGIMVHDGIDGVPECYLSRLPALIENIGIQLSGGL